MRRRGTTITEAAETAGALGGAADGADGRVGGHPAGGRSPMGFPTVWRIHGGAVAVIAGIRGAHRGAQQSAQARLVWRMSGRPLSGRLRPTPHQRMGARDHRGVPVIVGLIGNRGAQTNRAAQDYALSQKRLYSVRPSRGWSRLRRSRRQNQRPAASLQALPVRRYRDHVQVEGLAVALGAFQRPGQDARS